MKTKIIAEVGPNHNGDLKIALEIVSKLKNSGVDYVKFQLANPSLVYSKDSFLANYQKKNIKEKSIIEMSKKNQLSRKEHQILYEFCLTNRIRYSCSSFDLQSLKYVYENFNLPFFKIPSGEIFSLDQLDYIRKKDLKILMSTGVSDEEDISFTLDYLQKFKKKDITILHCISSYPAKIENLNLDYMLFLKNKFQMKVGYSDHSEGFEAPIVAASLGASYIEKHITLDKNLIGPDHKASMEIDDFIKLIKEIKKVNKIKGKPKKYISSDNYNVKNVAMKSCVSKKKLFKNQIIKKTDICFKRPGIGISPKNLKLFIGKRINKNIDQDKVIFKKDFKT
jgi:N,N'-diacetyllegionaminate synthase